MNVMSFGSCSKTHYYRSSSEYINKLQLQKATLKETSVIRFLSLYNDTELLMGWRHKMKKTSKVEIFWTKRQIELIDKVSSEKH